VPSGNTGKIIQTIAVKKKIIELTFLDGDTLELSPDIYTQNYYYIGKVLDPKTIESLQQASQLEPLLQYAFNLLSKGKYSEYQVREKLYRREAKKYQVEAIIERLKQAHLIDDETLIKEWVNYYQQRHYGPKWIEEKMYQKGFSQTLIKALPNQAHTELAAIEVLLPKLVKKYAHLSMQDRQHTIKGRLLTRGFSARAIAQALSALPEVDLEQELANLEKVYAKIHARLMRRYEGKALQEKIINFLLRKGYNYANIKRLLKESPDVD
jgi:SOS response regulatory protein OraA/RecX